MAYDVTRCPQTEGEMRDYFYTLIGRTMGGSADDWRSVLSRQYPWQGKLITIPPGPPPGVRLGPEAPFWGLTQQWSGGPKARVFLPTALAQTDENGNLWYTRTLQYIEDDTAPGSVHGVDFLWTWWYLNGHEYVPVTTGTVPEPPPTPGEKYTTEDEVQAMIAAATAPLEAQIAGAVKIGDKIGLQAAEGMLLCAEGGGPRLTHQPFNLRSRTLPPGPWESWEVVKGQ